AAGADAPRLPSPALLMRLALAYRSSTVLFAATELDLFSLLSDVPKTAEDVARASGAKLEPVRLLLSACAAEGLVTVENGRYRNGPEADAFLVRGRPANSASGLKY